MRHHDLVIIGTGSGNSVIDSRFDDLDVAIIEHGTFGGTCLNVGCIPTKMYVYAADVAETIRRSGRYGIDATVDKVRWTQIRDRVFDRIDPIAAAGREYRAERCPNVTVYLGHARFSGPKTLRVERSDGSGVDELSADRIVIAAGGRPDVPAEVTASGVPYETSDTIMRLDAVPERLIILGSGYIATEFAHVFSALGSRVSLVARSGVLLRGLDETLSRRFTELAAQRWDVHLGNPVTGLSGVAGDITVRLTDGTELGGDTVLVATGRIPNSDRLDLPAADIPVHPDGRIVVDAQQRTPVEGVWAFGDISSPYQLKHVANHEARVVAHNLTHPDAPRETDHRFVPCAVFTDPQIATVGRTEAQCRAEGLDYTVKVQAFGDVAYGWAMEDTTGLCKIIAERRGGRLLGAHLLGPQASTLIQPLIQAMTFGLGAREMATGQYWIHPALPEVVENALLGLETDISS
ncbi:mycothione reductase [Pseudonocardia asaccharolytica]|uniref:Mycothione reductase n=1 Tax=Pseudonocardia asaccharolytica DSM 44247 = NBRC 16224 TaxID=1123024 RepID=A0A511CZ29_9PSEU|nr:mycothione reductase [Pseudonocardia asaccharolytica]GEL17812.1 mycothione reductase [Pseudonocardia asaccharolytica DSM 44247 = NBRC 16224]